jgi:serine phosphatase RsbU (regulator of sigma subunit)
MDYYKRIFLVLFGVVWGLGFTYAQTRLDSLRQDLDRSNRNSIDKVKRLIVMSRALQRTATDKALIYAQQGLLISERLNYQRGISDALYYIANAYYQLDNYAKSLEYYLRALRFYRSQGIPAGEAVSLKNIGNIYFEFGDYAQSLSSQMDALKIYEKIKDQAGVAAAYGNIANVYAASNDYTLALEYYENSLKIAEKLKNQRIVGINYSNIGEVYANKKEYQTSLEYYQKAEAVFREIDLKENLASTLNGKGDVYKFKGQKEQAIAFYNEALEICKLMNDREGMSLTYYNMGDLYLIFKDTKQATSYFDQSMEIAQQIKLKKIIRDNYQKLATTNEIMNNAELALKNYKLFKIYNDSLYSQTRLSLLSEMQARFNMESKERENKLQKQLIEALNEQRRNQTLDIESKEKYLWVQTLVILAFIGISILIGVLAILLYRSRRESNLANAQLTQQNREINRQKLELEKKSEQLIQTYIKITDSIRYAETIQKSILPSETKMQEILRDYFVISRAKEVVSGDFYWVNKIGEQTFVAVVDCTGHGVSGGFMTMIGHTLLNEIITQQSIYSPALVLENLNFDLANIIQRQNQDIAIGMEVGLCRIEPLPENPQKVKITYAGAKRPLLSIKLNGSLPTEEAITELRGDREPIGFASITERTYQNQELIVDKGTVIYLASDGFADQANPQNKRLGSPKLKEVLLVNSLKDLKEQKQSLEELLKSHQQNASQRDDITIMGIKV